MDDLIKGVTEGTKAIPEVREALPLSEPETGVSWTTGIGLAALVVIIVAAFAKYRCKCKK
tara:strand:- start:45 stop:224 length:180 start_codon:yes stop_codon:yes gene_type:complete